MKTLTTSLVSGAVALGAISLRAETLDTLQEYGGAAAANATSDNGTARGANFSGAALGNYTLTAGGVDLWGNSDQGSFIVDADGSRAAGENFSAIVRSVSVGAGEQIATEWGRTGIMARKNPNDAASANVAHIRKSGFGNADNTAESVLQGRPSDGAGTDRGPAEDGEFKNDAVNIANGSVQNSPIWLGLHRFEGDWYGSYADDVGGNPGTWSTAILRSGTPDTQGEVWVGLCHQSHDIHPVVNTAVFEQFQVGPFDSNLGVFNFPIAPNGSLDVSGTEVRVTASRSQVGGGAAQDANWEVQFISNEPSLGPGILAEIYFIGNAGNLAAAQAVIAGNEPDAAPIISRLDWGGPDRPGFTYPPEFNATTGQFTGNQENFMVNHLAEIYIAPAAERDPGPDGNIDTVAFKDGVDDYTYLVVDGQALIDDNAWTGGDGSENGGSPIVQLDVSDSKYDEGAWAAFQLITWEGGGGDAGILYTDMYDGDDNFPVNITDPATLGDLIPAANFRTTIPTTLLTSEGDVGQPDMQLLATALPPDADQVLLFVEGTLVDTLLVDRDGDGIPNTYEKANGLDPDNPDDASQGANDGLFDNDGSTNLEEFQRGTDPNNADTDGDGAPDGAEDGGGEFVSTGQTGTDPLNPDTDGDGLKDGVENPLLAYDPNNARNQPGTDPHDPDSDDDGVPDGGEVINGSDPTDPNSLPGLSPNAVLKEDWDGFTINSVWNLTNTSGAAANVFDTGGPNGKVMRITNLNGSNNNSIAWDFTSYAADEIAISFLVSMSDNAANATAGGCCGEAADGFGFGLFDTAFYGTAGATNPSLGVGDWEDPRTNVGFANALMIGFDVFDNGGPNGNNVRVTGVGGASELLGDFAAPFEINNNLFHKVIAKLVSDNAGGSTLSVRMIEDINGAAIEHDIITDLAIPTIDPQTFEGRLIAGGRTGGAFVETLLDCVQIEAFTGDPLRVTEVQYDQANDEFTLSWTANEGKSYGLFFSEDASDWSADVNDSILAVAPSADPLVQFADGVLSYGPFANPTPGSPVVLFRAQQN